VEGKVEKRIDETFDKEESSRQMWNGIFSIWGYKMLLRQRYERNMATLILWLWLLKHLNTN
jgi:hypothetical protein